MPYIMTKGSERSPQQAEQHVLQLMREGKLREAAAASDELTQTYPDYDSGWRTASQLAMNLNEPAIALRAIDQALRVSPGKPEWLLQKMACLAVKGDISAAKVAAAELERHDFDAPYHAATCGLTLIRLGLFEGAEHHYRRAVALEPDNGTNHYNLATVLRFLGRLNDAASSLGRAVELNPDDFDAHLLRSGLRTQTAEENHLESLRAVLERTPEKHPGRVRINYALAKELEDVEDFDASFECLSLAASARRSAMQYHPERDLATMRKIREVYTEDVFGGSVEGFVNADPIFVIGSPRTGTTLVDRILNSHSVVESAGELQAFGIELVNQCMHISDIKPQAPADLVPLTRQIDFAALGEAYVGNARPKTAPTAHFIDKLPMNFLYAGLIHLALPKAKIVWLDRDPMDTCYAVYKTLFEGAYPYSYDLQELANYYVEYRNLMAHWFDVMPGVIHTVRYEDLVTEPRPVIESLLDYCGLSWEEQCLNFHESEDAVTTASAAQVRQALHAGSVGKWHNYEKQLQPVVEILQQAGVLQDTNAQ
jgi:tetratricopeptide (TPR) repeat protein